MSTCFVSIFIEEKSEYNYYKMSTTFKQKNWDYEKRWARPFCYDNHINEKIGFFTFLFAVSHNEKKTFL